MPDFPSINTVAKFVKTSSIKITVAWLFKQTCDGRGVEITEVTTLTKGKTKGHTTMSTLPAGELATDQKGLDELNMRELYEKINIRETSNTVEIRHPIYGGSITVYRPERERFQPVGDPFAPPKAIIKPGYINASSWNTGGLGPKEVFPVREALLIQLRMIAIAVDKLNEYNLVLPDWIPIDNPFDDARSLRNAYATIESLRAENEQLKTRRKPGRKPGRKPKD